MSPFKISPKTIWNYKQNKASLIVNDLVGKDADTETRSGIYKILLARGVFKWFAARRQIIRLKNEWKEAINWSLVAQKEARGAGKISEVHWQRGYRAGLEQARKQIRAVCHSDRWSVDPKDSKALDWLRTQPTEVAEKK